LGYGYQTWIVPGARRMFLLWGVHGQRIIVDLQSELVMVNTAIHKRAVDPGPLREMGGLWWALVRQLGD
jgi:CubicO group peptidase (beta-lactamase class C family)